MRARTVDEALATLDADSKILAGGQSLVPMLNMRLVRPRACARARTAGSTSARSRDTPTS